MAVNRENVQKWVDALRSGEYQQTRGRLQRTNPGKRGQPVGFCCLGVACEVLGLPEVDTTGELGVVAYDNSWNVGFPPSRIWDEFGVDDDVQLESDLAEMNDAGRTFAEIAAEIERRLLS